MIKGSIQEEDIAIINIYAPNVRAQGRGEEEVYHTFGLPLFIWYLVANEENEAQNKRKQNPAKVNTQAL